MLCSVAYDDSSDRLHLLGTIRWLFAAKAWYPSPNANTISVYNPTFVNEITKSPKIGAVKLIKLVVSNCSNGDEAMIKLFNIFINSYSFLHNILIWRSGLGVEITSVEAS